MFAWLKRLNAGAMAVCGAIVLLVVAYVRGRGAGRSAEREDRDDQINRQAHRARQEVKHVQHETARLDDAAIADELKRDWVRGAGPGGR
ncbi:hypothetical protein J2732_001886 [Achromobacter deleyi]|uniref:hypothetical protein n=1 Tax=Achromobacter deleyi TaxID=1353891 RepID=UPI00285DA8D0|nr:hypothetical protein [Achromobacter deleyi]MDR6600903.1 hypothetical protein [Achromobacter deleyi]